MSAASPATALTTFKRRFLKNARAAFFSIVDSKSLCTTLWLMRPSRGDDEASAFGVSLVVQNSPPSGQPPGTRGCLDSSKSLFQKRFSKLLLGAGPNPTPTKARPY